MGYRRDHLRGNRSHGRGIGRDIEHRELHG